MSPTFTSLGFRLTLAGALLQILSLPEFRWSPVVVQTSIVVSLIGLALFYAKTPGPPPGFHLVLSGVLIQMIAPIALGWGYSLILAGMWLSLGGLMLFARGRNSSLEWPVIVLVLIVGPLLWMTVGIRRYAMWPVEGFSIAWIVPILGLFLLDSQTKSAVTTLSAGLREHLANARRSTRVEGQTVSNSMPDSISPQKPSRMINIIAAMLFTILALAPTMCVYQGAQLYSDERKAATGEYFYVPFTHTGDRDYVKVGNIYLFSGVLGITALAYLSFGKNRTLKILACLGLVGALAIRAVPASVRTTPEYDVPIHARRSVERTMAQVHDTLLKSATTAGHFPRSEEELRLALQRIMEQHSMYARGGKHLSYSLVHVPQATGPHFPESPGPAPAVIYCAVSSDHRKFWLTGTVLSNLVDDRAYFLSPGYFSNEVAQVSGKAYLTGEVAAQ